MTPTPPLDYLRWLFRDAGLVELRHNPGSGNWRSAWHTDPEELLAAAGALSRDGNLYTSLHRPAFKGEPPGPIRNEHVGRYTRLFFDFDPVRPKDTPSTAAELHEARARAKGLLRTLAAHGWPRPAIAMSGNGFHLHYRTAIQNTPETAAMVREIYDGLHADFDDDVVSFDRTVKNPGRICALYGFQKRKGRASADRPHRTAKIVIPVDWRQVAPSQIAALADYFARRRPEKPPRAAQAAPGPRFRPEGAGDYRTLDVVAWATAHGAYRFPAGPGVHSVFCPWQSTHSTPHGRTGAVLLEATAGGWPNFKCHHQHCADRGIRDLFALWGDADLFCAATWQRRA